MFKTLNLGEKITYSIVASVVPVTMNGPARKEEKITVANYQDTRIHLRKRLLDQLFLSMLVNLAELLLITLGIVSQTKFDRHYHENINQIIPEGSFLAIISCSFISYLVSCLLFSTYYYCNHQGIIELDTLSVLPKIAFEQETNRNSENDPDSTFLEGHKKSENFTHRIQTNLVRKEMEGKLLQVKLTSATEYIGFNHLFQSWENVQV